MNVEFKTGEEGMGLRDEILGVGLLERVKQENSGVGQRGGQSMRLRL